jgi:hypothetical protein
MSKRDKLKTIFKAAKKIKMKLCPYGGKKAPDQKHTDDPKGRLDHFKKQRGIDDKRKPDAP